MFQKIKRQGSKGESHLGGGDMVICGALGKKLENRPANSERGLSSLGLGGKRCTLEALAGGSGQNVLGRRSDKTRGGGRGKVFVTDGKKTVNTGKMPGASDGSFYGGLRRMGTWSVSKQRMTFKGLGRDDQNSFIFNGGLLRRKPTNR